MREDVLCRNRVFYDRQINTVVDIFDFLPTKNRVNNKHLKFKEVNEFHSAKNCPSFAENRFNVILKSKVSRMNLILLWKKVKTTTNCDTIKYWPRLSDSK